MRWSNLEMLAAIKPLYESIPWRPIWRRHPDSPPEQFFPDLSAFAALVDRLLDADLMRYEMVVPGWYVVDSATESSGGFVREHHYSYVTVTWIDHAWTVRRCETGDVSTF